METLPKPPADLASYNEYIDMIDYTLSVERWDDEE